MATRPKYAVHFFTEDDGFVVRGTLDPHHALSLAVAEDGKFTERYWAAEEAARSDATDREPIASEVDNLANLCHTLIQNAKPGLYRMNVASEGDREDMGINWWLRTAKQPGRGVWRGVQF